MMRRSPFRFPLLLALAAALGAAPSPAEGQEKPRERVERSEERRERPELRRRDDRREAKRGGPHAVPPGWCKGKGNPHSTLENCGGSAWSRDRDRRDDGRYDTDRGGSGSYEAAHEEFHREHDRVCRMRAAERPLDVQWQLRVRSECRERHDRWHARAGRRHG